MSGLRRKRWFWIGTGLIVLLGATAAAGYFYWNPPGMDEPVTFTMQEHPLFEPGNEMVRFAMASQPLFVHGGFGSDLTSIAGGLKGSEHSGTRYPPVSSSDAHLGILRIGVEDLRLAESGSAIPFFLDERDGTGTGFDTLIVDTNQNGDLTDDVSVHPTTDQRAIAFFRESPGLSPQVIFDPIELTIERNDARRSLRVTPTLSTYERDGERTPLVGFLNTRIFIGRVRFGRHRYRALLASAVAAGGRYDQGWSDLILRPADPWTPPEDWHYYQSLANYHWCDGRFYTATATPDGRRITVAPADEPLGQLVISRGDRDVGPATMWGVLNRDGQSRAHVPVGKFCLEPGAGYREPTDRSLVPEGDYAFDFFRIVMPPYSIMLSNNYHTDGAGQGFRRPEAPIHIRAGEPFEVSFMRTPEVIFTAPADGASVSPGDEVTISPVLIDRQLDIMYRDLQSRSSASDRRTAGSDAPSVRRPLAPTVTVLHPDGEVLAEGTAPFG